MVDFFYSFWMAQSGVVFWHGKDRVLKLSAPKPDEKRSSLIRLQTWGTKSPKGDSQKWWLPSEVEFESTINVHSFHPFDSFLSIWSRLGATFRQVALARGAHPVLSCLARRWGGARRFGEDFKPIIQYRILMDIVMFPYWISNQYIYIIWCCPFFLCCQYQLILIKKGTPWNATLRRRVLGSARRQIPQGVEERCWARNRMLPSGKLT